MRKNLKKFIVALVISGLISLIYPPAFLVNAGDLDILSDEMSRLKISDAKSDHNIKFKTPTGVESSTDKIAITFPSDFVMGTVAFGDMDLEIDPDCDGVYEVGKTLDESAGASPIWGVGIAGLVVTLTAPNDASVGEIAANACVLVEIGENATDGANQITNPTTSGSKTIGIAGDFGDTGSIIVHIVDDDQVAVSGTVPESISFSIEAPTDNAIGFGTLSTTALRYPTDDNNGTPDVPTAGLPIQLKASTNINSGLTISGRSEGSGTVAGLYKTVATAHNIVAVASSLVLATEEKYGVYAKNNSNLTIDAGFDNGGGGDLAITYDAITIATAGSAVDGGTIDIVPIAAISGSTPAGSYADALTFLCTGNF